MGFSTACSVWTLGKYEITGQCTMLYTYLVDNQLDGDVFEHIP